MSSKHLLSSLSSKGRLIISFAYGLDGHEPKLQREIGKGLGITQPVVSRKIKRIIKRLGSIAEAKKLTRLYLKSKNYSCFFNLKCQ
ncbi:MAG: sigma factor-like helix-turn-helix DNA-binding protein [Bacilli bacterium]